MKKLLVLFGAFLALPIGVLAQEKHVTVTYDLSQMVNKTVEWRRPGIKRMIRGLESIVETVVAETKLAQSELTMRAINGKHLEIRASGENQKVIFTVLNAINRLMDIHVEFEVRILEVDGNFYAKTVAPELLKSRFLPIAIPDDQEGPLFKGCRPSQPNMINVTENEKHCILSIKRALPYEWLERHGMTREMKAAHVGIAVEVVVRISPDRESVNIYLTQNGAELVENFKVKTLDAQLNQVELIVPRIRKLSTTVFVTINDGVALVMPASVAVPGYEASIRTLLVLLRPRIRIGDEERNVIPIISRR